MLCKNVRHFIAREQKQKSSFYCKGLWVTIYGSRALLYSPDSPNSPNNPNAALHPSLRGKLLVITVLRIDVDLSILWNILEPIIVRPLEDVAPAISPCHGRIYIIRKVGPPPFDAYRIPRIPPVSVFVISPILCTLEKVRSSVFPDEDRVQVWRQALITLRVSHQ